MQNGSNTKSPRLSWLESHLLLAQAVLQLQQEVIAIKGALAMRKLDGSEPRSLRVDLKTLVQWIEAIGKLASTPFGQMVIGIAMAGAAALWRWITRAG